MVAADGATDDGELEAGKTIPAEPDPSNPTAELGIVDVKSGAEGVAHLASQLTHLLLEEALAACDDRKPFHAHCTLGRVKPQRNVQPLVTRMQQEGGFTAGPAVSFRGSPTVSPVTAALWASDPLPP